MNFLIVSQESLSKHYKQENDMVYLIIHLRAFRLYVDGTNKCILCIESVSVLVNKCSALTG